MLVDLYPIILAQWIIDSSLPTSFDCVCVSGLNLWVLALIAANSAGPAARLFSATNTSITNTVAARARTDMHIGAGDVRRAPLSHLLFQLQNLGRRECALEGL